MAIFQQRDLVLPHHLCTRCGTCQAICPQNVIEVDEADYPHRIHRERCIGCNRCMAVCPGIGVDFYKIEEVIFNDSPGCKAHPGLGLYHDVFIGYSVDENLRKNSSSGGVVSSLLYYAFEKKLIDGIISVRMRLDKPWKAESFIAQSIDDLKDVPQAKYQRVPVNAVLKDAEHFSHLAVVGLPCHIHAIRKYELLSNKFKDKVKYHLGIFCNSVIEPEATVFLLRKMGIKLSSIKRIQYRGKGWPGGFVVELDDGTEQYLPKEEYSLLLATFISERCLYCIDFTNELADISFGDAKFLYGQGEGWTSVIARTKIGQELLRGALQCGFITLEENNLERILSSQKFGFNFKKVGAQFRIKMLGKKTQPVYNSRFNNILLSRKKWKKEQKFMLFYRICKAMRFFMNMLPFSFFKRWSVKMTEDARKGKKTFYY